MEPSDDMGTYWYDDPATRTNGEFDVVTHDHLGYAFYEAKVRSIPVDTKTIAQEIDQVEACGLTCHKHGLFSRSGFTAQSDDRTVLISLPELFA